MSKYNFKKRGGANKDDGVLIDKRDAQTPDEQRAKDIEMLNDAMNDEDEQQVQVNQDGMEDINLDSSYDNIPEVQPHPEPTPAPEPKMASDELSDKDEVEDMPKDEDPGNDEPGGV